MDWNLNKKLEKIWNYCKNNYKKIIVILTLILIIFLFLPIYPSTETEIFEVRIPHKEYEHQGFLEYKIQIIDKCPSLYSYDNSFEGISNMNNLYFNTYNDKDKKRVIELEYQTYLIGIFGLEKCDCINNNDVGFQQPQSCVLNNTRIYGYLQEKDDKTSPYYPFALDSHLQLLSPNKGFKLSFEVNQTKEGVSSNNYININSDYIILIKIAYPKNKINPYILNIAKWVIIAKDPLKAVYDAKKEEWEYK